VSHWPGGSQQGYGVVLFVGVIFGILSLGCQYFKIDVNPKLQNTVTVRLSANINPGETPQNQFVHSIRQNSNMLKFLLYISLWMLGTSLSSPFFNFYMLATLDLDVSWVTFYGSLQAGANLLMLTLWGKLADKVGNLPILIFIGILVAIQPLFWLLIGTSQFDLWLWLPLLHIFSGGTLAAINLCTNNIQIGIVPVRNQSIYFAIGAAISGVSGALGTIIGGCIAQFQPSGLLSLFATSGLLQLAALLPLIFISEPGK